MDETQYLSQGQNGKKLRESIEQSKENKSEMEKEDSNYIVFAEDSTAMIQESLIQQSNPLTKERAIEFAERIKDRDNLFCITILKRISKEELTKKQK